VPCEPTLQRPIEADARERAFGDRRQERVDLVEPPLGGIDIAADREDVV
jgi:hypothetical protein